MKSQREIMCGSNFYESDVLYYLLILGSFLISTTQPHPVGLVILAHQNGGIDGSKIYITCILGSFYS